MKPLEDLINLTEPALPFVKNCAARAVHPVEILPPSESRASVLFQTQVTTRSPMGAVAYETGGILVDHGWLRFLGSGHPRLSRTLPHWNEGRSDGFYLVADDAVGGFFACNGGALGKGMGTMFYFAPDTLEWFEMNGMGYSEFLEWSCAGRLDDFYRELRWKDWEPEVAKLPGDSCISFYPPLFTKESKGKVSQRAIVPVAEAWSFNLEMQRQLKSLGDPGTFRISVTPSEP